MTENVPNIIRTCSDVSKDHPDRSKFIQKYKQGSFFYQNEKRTLAVRGTKQASHKTFLGLERALKVKTSILS